MKGSAVFKYIYEIVAVLLTVVFRRISSEAIDEHPLQQFRIPTFLFPCCRFAGSIALQPIKLYSMEILNLRRIVMRVLLLTLVSLTLSCSKEPIEIIGEPVLEFTAATSSKSPEFIKDQYIVLLSKKPAKADSRAEAALEALTKEVGNMPNAGMKGIYRAALTGFVAQLSPTQLEKIKSDKRVLAVYQDRIIELEATEYTDDPTTTNVQEYATWGLDRVDQREENLNRAYAFTGTGSGVNVYIMDSGINYTHNEFEGRASLGVDLVRLYPDPEFDQDDPEVEDGGDCSGHGTHVAGTVGGKTYGVAKNASLISVRVFSCYGRTTWSRIIHAVDWITANAVKPAVVNMSLGDVGKFDAVQTAIETSIASGINYVVSAGNSQMDACDYTPAYMPGVLTVGASDIYNSRASFSNYGACLDLYAPGVQITSAGIADDISTRYMSGTSMAAPHVTGMVAIYLEKNPEATPAGVHQAVVENSTPAAVRDVPSGTTALAYSLWESVEVVPPVAPQIELKGFLSKVKGEYAISLQWNTPEERSHDVYKDGVKVASFVDGENSYLEYTSLRNATFIYQVCSVAYNNCSRELKVVIGDGGDTSEPVNAPPTADFSFSANLLDVQFTDASTDTDGTIQSREWNFGDGTSSSLQHPQHTYSQAGTYEVSLNVTDDLGSSHSITKNVVVSAENSAPAGLELTAVGSKVKGQWTTDLSWTPAGTSAQIDIYRDGVLLATVSNSGSFTDNTSFKGGGTLTYQVCESGTTLCSGSVTVQF